MSNPNPLCHIVVRQLASSDLGWFAEPRDSGTVSSKQRAINFNAAAIGHILPPSLRAAGEITVQATCLRSDASQTELRPLSKVHKNWRLGGKKVAGAIFGELRPDDWFVARIERKSPGKWLLDWVTIQMRTEPVAYRALSKVVTTYLDDRMCVFPQGQDKFSELDRIIRHVEKEEVSPSAGATEGNLNPIPTRKVHRHSVTERVKQPHILGELVKIALGQSSIAQRDFLTALQSVAESIREMLDGAGMIRSVEVDHTKLWREASGRPITFVDGGMANVASLGSAPVAIRVGSYTVVPGAIGDARERFQMEKQLVAELFDVGSDDALFDQVFEDPSKLREAARFCAELSGAVGALNRKPKPEFVFLHGTLVNPVSAYADKDFPAFSKRGLEVLLPHNNRDRSGREACFASVYLRLLEDLRSSGMNIASVVERASQSILLSTTLLDQLKTLPVSPGASEIEERKRCVKDYRLTDSVLFHAILNEGEYIVPTAVDRNVEHKRPQYSADIIAQYPKPHVTYLGVGEFAQPLRVEFFDEPPAGYDYCLRLVLHSCRLMPSYAFPAGLDIVDKFAKVPDWMSRPISSTMAVQMLKRAIDTGNPKIIEAAKQMLCGTKRDWLFRPNFNA